MAQRLPRTTWTASDGKFTFCLTNGSRHQFTAHDIDRPVELSALVDRVAALSSTERRALAVMLSSLDERKEG